MRAQSTTAASLLLALTWPGVAFAQAPTMDDWKIERIERKVAVEPGAAIRIENPHGQVRVRSGSDEELLVLANAQHHADDPRPVEIELVAEGQTGTARVRWAEAENAPTEIPQAWAKRRVDIAVLVPPGAEISILVRDDFVELKGTRGKATVRTEGGDVKMRHGGAVDVTTGSGSVYLQLPAQEWSGPSRIETQVGEITVYLKDGLDARLEVSTEGEITTDYSLTVERDPRPSLRKNAVAVLGDGGPRMEIQSVRGPVKLLELYLID